MSIPRLPVCLLLFCAPALAAPHWGHDGSGKPAAPVDLEVELTHLPGGDVAAQIFAQPRCDALVLHVEVQLPHGGDLLDQRRIEAASIGETDRLEGWARIAPPQGLGGAQIEVVATLIVDSPTGGIAAERSLFVSLDDLAPPVDARLVERAGRPTRAVGTTAAQAVTPSGSLPTHGGATAVASGTFRYVDREYTLNGWTGNEPERPIRFAHVELIDVAGDTILATGTTAADGSFALPLPGAGAADVEVRCYSYTEAFGPARYQSTDVGLVPYSVASATFSGWDLGADLDVGSVVAGKTYSGNLQGGPFSHLDVLVDTALYLDHLGAQHDPLGMTVMWPGGTQTFATSNFVYMSTGDGFDDSVALHELGHVIGFLYSDTDHGGGSHAFGESDQHPTLSLGEGYASFFGGAVRQHAGYSDPGIYADLKGNGSSGPQSVQLRLDFESGFPWSGGAGGEADEVAICCALWNLVDTAATDDGDGVDDDPVDGSFLFPGGLDGDALLWAAYTGSTVLAAEPVNVLDLWEGLFVDGGASEYDALAAVFDEWKIRFHPDAAEPDGSDALGTPLTLDQWTEIRTLYDGAGSPPVPGDGDRDYFEFEAQALDVIEVATRYPFGKLDAETYCDPFVTLIDPSGAIVDVDDDSGTGRNAFIEVAVTETGTYRVIVESVDVQRRTGSYQVRARVTGTVDPPQITSVTPLSVEVGGLTSLTLSGSGLLGITDVLIGTSPVPVFWILDDQTLSFTVPLVDQLGTVDVIIAGPAGSSSIQVQVTGPSEPTLLAGTGHLFWSSDTIKLRTAAEPNGTVFVVYALQDGPTVLPGIADLAIGAGAVELLWTAQLNSAGAAEQTFPLPPELTGGIDVWLQGIAVGATPMLPLPTTNVEVGKIF